MVANGLRFLEAEKQEFEKKRRLQELLHNIMDGSKILIFVETKRGADTLTKEMRVAGWPALAIHGDKYVLLAFLRS